MAFYRDVLGMTLLNKFDFPEMSFSLYFLAYQDPGEIPTDPLGNADFVFMQKATLELTHNWGTESDANISGYHNGNADPRGFGHIGITVPDVYRACARFEELGAFTDQSSGNLRKPLFQQNRPASAGCHYGVCWSSRMQTISKHGRN